MANYPPGMIAYPCSDSGRTSDFLPNIVALQKPAGTMLKSSPGLGVAAPLNVIGRAFMERPELKWLFLTNDDNLCPTNTIPRLLDCAFGTSMGLGWRPRVVAGLYFGRIMPFEPILLDRLADPSAELLASAPAAKKSKRWYHRMLMRQDMRGYERVMACGDGCLMIPREVMEAIPDPWWEYGETLSDACDHDMVFSRKVREAGFDTYVDTTLHVGHVAQFVVRPFREPDGSWSVHLEQGDDGTRKLSVAAPREE